MYIINICELNGNRKASPLNLKLKLNIYVSERGRENHRAESTFIAD